MCVWGGDRRSSQGFDINAQIREKKFLFVERVIDDIALTFSVVSASGSCLRASRDGSAAARRGWGGGGQRHTQTGRGAGPPTAIGA